jgi:hypothetical protein
LAEALGRDGVPEETEAVDTVRQAITAAGTPKGEMRLSVREVIFEERDVGCPRQHGGAGEDETWQGRPMMMPMGVAQMGCRRLVIEPQQRATSSCCT